MFKKILAPLIIFLVLVINFSLGFVRLDKYSAVDEPYWTYGRISKFWTAVAQHKWRSTNINDKPGITVAILAGPGLLHYDPMQYKNLRGDTKTDAQLATVNGINFAFRLPIFLFCLFLLPMFFFLLKKLFDEKTALIAFMLIGLSPILLGISLIINPDSLLWLFLPLSLLSYFVFQKNANEKYLYLSGIFLGFSLLTKYVANILYIFFFLLPFLEYIFAEKKPVLENYLKKAALNYLKLVAISMAVFFIFYPAAWVNPKILLKGTLLSKAFASTWPLFAGLIALIAADLFFLQSKFSLRILNFFTRYQKLLLRFLSISMLAMLFFVLADTYTGMKMLNIEAILASPKSAGHGFKLFIYLEKMLSDLYSLVFGISPLAFLAFVFALCLPFRKKMTASLETRIVFYLTSFILFYYLASSVNDVVATVRYQIILYPLALIMAAIGLAQLSAWEKIAKYSTPVLLYVLVLGISAFSLFSVKPFYFAYSSALLPQKYFLNLKDMGDGSWEIADFLNQQPDAQNLHIWSDKGAVCAVFKGTCTIGFSNKDLAGKTFDYVVVSSGRKSRSLKLSGSANNLVNFKKAYTTNLTDYKVEIAGRPNNFVKIIAGSKLQNIPAQQ